MSDSEFSEISFIGQNIIITHKQATILPDRVFIQDLLNDIANTSELSTQEEYESFLNNTHN